MQDSEATGGLLIIGQASACIKYCILLLWEDADSYAAALWLDQTEAIFQVERPIFVVSYVLCRE